MIAELWTYHDLAARLKVSPKTLSKWICAMEAAGAIAPWRPTRNTVRLSEADIACLLGLRLRLCQVKQAKSRAGYRLKMEL